MHFSGLFMGLPRFFCSKKDQEVHMTSASQASRDSCIKSMKTNYSRIALKCALNRSCVQNKKLELPIFHFERSPLVI